MKCKRGETSREMDDEELERIRKMLASDVEEDVGAPLPNLGQEAK